jgi:hypothetical protein
LLRIFRTVPDQKRIRRARRPTAPIRARVRTDELGIDAVVRSVAFAFECGDELVLAALVEPLVDCIDGDLRTRLLAVLEVARHDLVVARMEWTVLLPDLHARAARPR